MTDEQKEEVADCNTELRRIYDVLELHELRLRNFVGVKADPSDPYSIDFEDVADALYLCRDNLNDAIELLRAFKDEESEVANA